MTSIAISVAVFILTFGSGLLGLYIQKRLPQSHLSGGSKDMILGVIGLLTLLLALVLGTLVGNTYAFFAMQKSELETMASRALLVDQALAAIWPRSQAGAQSDETGARSKLRALLAGRGRRPYATQSRASLSTVGSRSRTRSARSIPRRRRKRMHSPRPRANLALMEQTQTLDVPAAVEFGRLVAGDQRHLLVDVPVLRPWDSRPGPIRQLVVALALRRDFRRKRDVPDSRPDPPLFWSVSGFRRSAIQQALETLDK